MSLVPVKHYCPCCGFSGLESSPYRMLGPPPWSNHGSPPYCTRYSDPSYEVCACCGFEFGNDDDPGTSPGESFEGYRRRWVAAGAEWFSAKARPEGWSLAEQFRLVGITPDA